jgi:hypothetical protein
VLYAYLKHRSHNLLFLEHSILLVVPTYLQYLTCVDAQPWALFWLGLLTVALLGMQDYFEDALFLAFVLQYVLFLAFVV